MFLVILLYALFASVFTIAKTGLEFASPLFFVGARMLVAGILMLVYQLIFKRETFIVKKADLSKFFQLALFNIYLTNILEFWGLQYLTSFKTCFIYSLSPFLAAIFSFFMFSERMNGKKIAGLLIGFVGFLPILLNESAGEEGTGHFLFLSGAELAVMGAATAGVYGWILLRKLVKEGEYTTFMANGVSMAIGGAMALTHSYAVEEWNPIPVSEFAPFLDCALLLILISNLICYNLYGYLLKKYSATFVSFAGFITPLFTALFGWFYLGEVVTWPFYLSASIVFCGLLIFYQEELKQKTPVVVEVNS